MARLWNRLERLSDPEWRLAVVLGLASVPFTIAFYWQSMPDFTHHVAPVFFAGVIGGILAHRTDLQARRVGVRTGVVSALAILWPFVDILVFISRLHQPIGFSGVQVVILTFFMLLVIGFSALVGKIGAVIGHWTLEKTETYRSRLGVH